MGGACADMLAKKCDQIEAWSSLGQEMACFRLEISSGPIAHQLVGFHQRAEGLGIFSGGDCADLLAGNCAQIETRPSLGQETACFRLKIPSGPAALLLVGLQQRAEGGGIFLGGACADLSAQNCDQIETWPSFGQETACFRLKIPSGPAALLLVGLHQRAEGGGIFLGGACADLLAKNCAQIETWPSIGQEVACFRLKIPSGPIAHQLVGLRQRAEGGGIFLGGSCSDLLAKNCAQVETWPSIGEEVACFRLKISSGPMARRLVGLRQRAEGVAFSWAALALTC